MDEEVHVRIDADSSAFGRFRSRVFSNHDHTNVKIKVYRAVIPSTLLYDFEAWTLYRRSVTKIEPFLICCLQKILRISFRDHATLTEILRRTGVNSVESSILRRQLRWTGHVIQVTSVRLSESRLPRILLYNELREGSRACGGQQKRFKDRLKRNLTICNINRENTEALAEDRAICVTTLSSA